MGVGLQRERDQQGDAAREQQSQGVDVQRPLRLLRAPILPPRPPVLYEKTRPLAPT